MSLKEQVEAMRSVLGKKACHHGYNLTNVVSTLYAYIAELEAKAATPVPAKKAPAKKAPAKKAPATKAPATKSPAKKAPATKAPAKKALAKKAPAKKTAKK